MKKIPQGEWEESEIVRKKPCQIATFKELAEEKQRDKGDRKGLSKARGNITEEIVEGQNRIRED